MKKNKLFVAITILPGLFLTFLFMIFPAMRMFRYSFFQVSSLMGNEEYVGLDNFKYMFEDKEFLNSLTNTMIIIAVYIIIVISAALLLSILITHSGIRGKGFYRVILFLPSVMSLVLTAIIWYFIFHPTYGVLNGFLGGIGLNSLQKAWLGDPSLALSALIIVMVWQAAGYYMIMYIAGIDRIPRSIYEAASLDGAGEFQKFKSITLPYLWTIIRMTVIFAIGGAINIGFIISRVMTNGGPGTSTTTILQYVGTQAFGRANFGYSMAISVIMLIISFGLAMLANRLTRTEEIES